MECGIEPDGRMAMERDRNILEGMVGASLDLVGYSAIRLGSHPSLKILAGVTTGGRRDRSLQSDYSRRMVGYSRRNRDHYVNVCEFERQVDVNK